MPSNSSCGSPALKGQFLCYNHHRVKKLTGRPARYGSIVIPFVYPEDTAAINLNLFLVLQAQAEGKIDSRTANSMTANLRAAAVNLRRQPLVEQDPRNTVQRVILTLEGDEIALPRELLEKGEALVHGAECPCRVCAEEFRNAPPEQHHPDCKCGLCEEESGQPSAIGVQEAADQQTRAQEPALLSPFPFPLSPVPPPALTARAVPAGKLSHQPIELDPPADDHSDDRAIGGKHERRYKHIIDEFERNRETAPSADDFPDIRAMGRKHEQRYQHVLEEIEKNREAARQSWNKQHPDQPIEHTPYLTWGQKQDLKIAQMKKLQQEDEQRQREAVAAANASS
jgi:hypothetical protein